MRRILLVEDNEGDQFLGKFAIESVHPDIKIFVASDGREAIEILNDMEIDPDLILLDINMPRMNGHEFLKVFTEDNSRVIPVVVMLTSSDQQKDKDQAFTYKCVKDYLLKPISEEDILAIEKIVLDVKKAA